MRKREVKEMECVALVANLRKRWEKMVGENGSHSSNKKKRELWND